ncbi:MULTISPECIES: hypothetical protein [Photorhabdus]|uniref:DUF600 family protein n=1 Tax=Photorhabdus heterorhabditis TaxID=880156 RepID=A0A5B0VKN4_9GAMM|nr:MULTISPECIES: hypothetical protein [Photorhabdus]KAA1174529.1 hypothetical protein F0L16_21050 [Photorhabdus heterorhabditis]NHB63664.1 hypothetical protein [Photorhabdus sp. RW14-46]
MTDDLDIYQKIGQLLVDAGPSDAQKMIVRAKLFPENDGCKYEFDYIDENGELGWFSPDSKAPGDLTELLVQLRSFFVDNNLTNGKPAWSGCEITVDLDKMKINIDFKYDD